MGDKKEERRIGLEKALWKHCPIHDVDYPANSTCPECSRAKER